MVVYFLFDFSVDASMLGVLVIELGEIDNRFCMERRKKDLKKYIFELFMIDGRSDYV